jgi:hypothetical protein
MIFNNTFHDHFRLCPTLREEAEQGDERYDRCRHDEIHNVEQRLSPQVQLHSQQGIWLVAAGEFDFFADYWKASVDIEALRQFGRLVISNF